MQYMLLIYSDSAADAAFQAMPQETRYAPWIAYTTALREAGVMVGGNPLAPAATATTMRLRDGHRQVQDGPVAASKEQLGGYYLIEAADLDAALEWAARCPAAAYGSVEVRPIGAM